MKLSNTVDSQTGYLKSLARYGWCFAAVILIAVVVSGCQTNSLNEVANRLPAPTGTALLAEGDIVQISFPGTTNLNTREKIRRDGTVNLPLIGSIKAAQKTLADFQKEVSTVYKPHLESEDVQVSLDSSAVPVYVSGSVVRPGKIISDRPLTALEAIMEAGGFDQQHANLKKVVVVRYVNGKRVGSVINLEAAVKGGQSQDAPLQPNDMVFVPEKLQLF